MTNVETSSVSKPAVTSENLLRSAMDALRAGDAVRATDAASEARRIDQSGYVLIVFAAISHALGRDIDALAMLDQAMKQEPGTGNYPDAAAAILLKLGRKADGIFNLKLGTHLPSDPFLNEIIGNYFGNIKDIFGSFIENRPLAAARFMIEQGLYAAALRQLETYIGISGGDAESFSLTVECAIHLNAVKEAEVALAALGGIDPTHPRLSEYRLGLAIMKGDASAVAEVGALPSPSNLADALSRYRLLAFSPLIAPEVLEKAQADIAAATEPVEPHLLPFDSAGWPNELTLGFVCGGIDPALESMLLALKGRVEVRIYVLGTMDNPSLQRTKAAFETVREVASIDDATLVEMIRFDQVSVLFDCIGPASFARPALWNARMAPVQVLWAMAGSYDNLLSYDCRLAFEPGRPEADPRVIDLGLPVKYPLPPAELMGRIAEIRAMKLERDPEARDFLRLLAPHVGSQLPDETLDLYLSILQSVPKATLAFVAEPDLEDALVSRVLAQADRRGCADQIDLIAPTDFVQSRHEIMLDADLILDSVPFGNPDLVMECLWISVPILTLSGERVRERASAALIEAAEVEGLIAKSRDHYQERAIGLLSDRKALEVLRTHMAAQQKKLTLAKYDEVAVALVTKMESLWRDWCSKNI